MKSSFFGPAGGIFFHACFGVRVRGRVRVRVRGRVRIRNILDRNKRGKNFASAAEGGSTPANSPYIRVCIIRHLTVWYSVCLCGDLATDTHS